MTSGLMALQRRLRDRAEHHLRVAAMEEMRRRHPYGTTAPYRDPGDLLWRRVFVPLYMRVPWETKERAMHALRMTAERSGWTAPQRHPTEPWRPPPTSADGS
jgi:hypothetical protein